MTPNAQMIVFNDPAGADLAVAWLKAAGYDSVVTTTPLGSKLVVSDGCEAFFLQTASNLANLDPRLRNICLQGKVTPLIAAKIAAQQQGGQ